MNSQHIRKLLGQISEQEAETMRKHKQYEVDSGLHVIGKWVKSAGMIC